MRCNRSVSYRPVKPTPGKESCGSFPIRLPGGSRDLWREFRVVAADAQSLKMALKGPFSREMLPPQKRVPRSKPGRNPKAHPIFQVTLQDQAYYQITPTESCSCPCPWLKLPSPYWGQNSNCEEKPIWLTITLPFFLIISKSETDRFNRGVEGEKRFNECKFSV